MTIIELNSRTGSCMIPVRNPSEMWLRETIAQIIRSDIDGIGTEIERLQEAVAFYGDSRRVGRVVQEVFVELATRFFPDQRANLIALMDQLRTSGATDFGEPVMPDSLDAAIGLSDSGC